MTLGINLCVKSLNFFVVKLKTGFFAISETKASRPYWQGRKVFLLFLLLWVLPFTSFGEIHNTVAIDTSGFSQLVHISKIYSLDSTLARLDSAEKLARTSRLGELLATVYLKRGDLFFKKNRLVSADSNYRMAWGELVNRKKDTGYLSLLKKLAVCNYYLGDNPEVLNFTKEGLKVARQLNDTSYRGTFNNISGIVADGMGNRAASLKYYFKALEIFTLQKDVEKMASVEMNIGTVYVELKNFGKAEKYYQKVLLEAEKIQDTSLMAASYNNLANIYSERQNYKKALAYTFKSLELSRKIKDMYTQAMDLNNIGDAYEKLKEYDKSFEYYSKALRLAQKIQNKSTVSLCFSNLAEIFEIKKNIPQAVKYARKSWELLQSGGDVDARLASLKQLQHLYALQNNYKDAYKLMLEYSTLHDSIYSDKNEARLAKVQMDYAFKAKDQSLHLAKERQKLFMAYFLISLFALLLAIGFGVYLIKLRSVKSRALANRAAFVDSLLEYSESFVLLLDENLRISYLSPSYQKAFGHYLQERKGGSPFDFVHPDEEERLKETLKKLTRGELKRIEFPFRLKKSDGEYRFMQGIFNNRLDNPDLHAYVLNFWDITELRETQQAISESEKKYFNIFNAFPDIYFKIDRDGTILEISPSVKTIAGYERKDVLGKSLDNFVELNMTWEKAGRALRKLQNVKDFNLVLRTKNGKRIYCSLNVYDIKNSREEVAGFEGVLRDITGRVLAQKQLKESESELKEANTSKDKILSIIGHDLLGPIGTQKSIMDMVIDEVDDFSREEILRLLQSMKPSLDATYTMIENLLSWARIMRHSIKPNLQQNNLGRIVEKSFDLLNQQAVQKNIKLVYVGDKETMAVFDKNLIEIVIRNLLSNAIKFSNPDSEIRVSVVQKENGVEVSVSDQGMGLSDADIQKILNEKEKMESRLGTKKEKGTGLGLIVVKEFIQHNNGQLHIQSQPGKGTTFSFILPGV